MQAVNLNAPNDAPMLLWLRPLNGADELSIGGETLADAAALLARLSDGAPVEALNVSQLDRGLAGLYTAIYGDAAECRSTCAQCSEVYEFTLSLRDIIAAQDEGREVFADSEGLWHLPDGARLRAPLLADITDGGVDLLSRLVVEGTVADAEVEAFLEQNAPVLSLDIDAACAHCGAAAQVRFDLAGYLLKRLLSERAFLLRETHLLATRYHWSHAEIVALSREDRRAYAGLIEAERARLSRRQLA